MFCHLMARVLFYEGAYIRAIFLTWRNDFMIQEPVSSVRPKTTSGPNIIVEEVIAGSVATLKCLAQSSPPPIFR